MVRLFVNGSGDWDSISGRVIPKTQKMLNTQHYKVCIKVKWNNPEKVVPPLHLGVVAIEKGAFDSLSTTVGQLVCMYERGREIRRKLVLHL